MSFLKKAVKGVGNLAKTVAGGKQKKRILITLNIQSMTASTKNTQKVKLVWKRGSKETSNGVPFQLEPAQQNYSNLNQVFERESLFMQDKDTQEYSSKDCDIQLHSLDGSNFVVASSFNVDMAPLVAQSSVQKVFTLEAQNGQLLIKNEIVYEQSSESSESEEVEVVLTDAEEQAIRGKYGIKIQEMKQEELAKILKIEQQTDKIMKTRKKLEAQKRDLEKKRNEEVTLQAGKEKEYISAQRALLGELHKKLEAEKKRKELLNDSIVSFNELKERMAAKAFGTQAEKLAQLHEELKSDMTSKQNQVEDSVAVRVCERAYQIEFDDY